MGWDGRFNLYGGFGCRCSKARFGEAQGDQADQSCHHEGGHDDEPVITGGINGSARVHQRDRFAGQAGESGIDRPYQQIGAEAAGHSRKGSGNTGQRGASGQLEHQPGERDQHDIAGIHRHARQHSGERYGDH